MEIGLGFPGGNVIGSLIALSLVWVCSEDTFGRGRGEVCCFPRTEEDPGSMYPEELGKETVFLESNTREDDTLEALCEDIEEDQSNTRIPFDGEREEC